MKAGAAGEARVIAAAEGVSDTAVITVIPVTLRALLSHTSGVRNAWFPNSGKPFPADPYTPVTRAQVVSSLNSFAFDSEFALRMIDFTPRSFRICAAGR